ncbi:alpha-1,4-N-acetylglucosaminyltransferase-like [Heterodontus francisci]|uniref:alpha-1,4-N-acetylglucosaminyltransferase-like n=1 Tax=Heterodontus francisci TaxID=7792 RepID=UPI00355C2E56
MKDNGHAAGVLSWCTFAEWLRRPILERQVLSQVSHVKVPGGAVSSYFLALAPVDKLLLALVTMVSPHLERHWTHVLADSCRLALLRKYSGIYLDTDIISMKSLLFANFTCFGEGGFFNNGALGFHVIHHDFLLDCMKDFVANYIEHIWGHQGRKLITCVLKRWCKSNNPTNFIGKECNGISLWLRRWFYPISYSSWERYYVPWKNKDIESIFSGRYGAHVWNYVNSSKERKIIAGEGSLMEYLFQMYCPITYRSVIQSKNHSELLKA